MIICNATPLIAFARIQRLDILRETVGELVIPELLMNFTDIEVDITVKLFSVMNRG